MADHFRAYDYVVSHLNHPFDETLNPTDKTIFLF